MDHLESILAVCGVISVVGGAGAIIFKVVRPAFKLNSRVEELERLAKKDYLAIEDLVEQSKSQSRALLAMMNHMIDGNSVDRLRETRDRMQMELIDR